MDFDLKGLVRQMGFGFRRDGEAERLRLNREGALHINSREALVDAWTRAGRVFTFSNPAIQTPETMSAAGTALTLTDPSTRFTVPSGALVVPISVKLKVAQVAAKDDIFAVIASEGDSYSSGGEDCSTPAPLLMLPNNDNEIPATITKVFHSDTAIVEAALTRPRLLHIEKKEGIAAAVADFAWNPEYNILRGHPMIYMKGPASFLVFEVQETTAAEAQWTVTYAVLDAGVTGR